MWAFLQHLSFWDWLALGTVLLILEVFGAGGYLLWIGMAAAAVGVLDLYRAGHVLGIAVSAVRPALDRHRPVLVATPAQRRAPE